MFRLFGFFILVASVAYIAMTVFSVSNEVTALPEVQITPHDEVSSDEVLFPHINNYETN